MKSFQLSQLKNIFVPTHNSHKGQNGRLLIIGGSHLFHSASLWSLQVASRIVDLVHYCSVEENNLIVSRLKEEFRGGIVIPRKDIESYIEEDDCILIGPGMMRVDHEKAREYTRLNQDKANNLLDILEVKDEGLQTYLLTRYLLIRYPKKKWVIDAGALQMMELEWIPEGAILTPHHKEFETLKGKIQRKDLKMQMSTITQEEQVEIFAAAFTCTVLLKGEHDVICTEDKNNTSVTCCITQGGNAGMTKGGTGDVLAGLVASLYCKNNGFLAASSASYLNKKAGEQLEQTMGIYFNASDLANQIPNTMKLLLNREELEKI